MNKRRESYVTLDSIPNNGTILVIEDDPRMQKVLKRLFAAEGYAVEGAADGKLGIDAFHSLSPSAVVLDLMLPGVPGREVCKRIKGASPNTPIIVVSAVTEVADKVLLLELGADDYVTKPFSPRELLARVQAALRRTSKATRTATVAFGICEVDYLRMSVRKSGHQVALTAHEFKLLKFFLENPERVLGREELLNDVWGYNFYPTTRTVDNQILKLRQKLEVDPGNPLHFVTVHGAGYKFVP